MYSLTLRIKDIADKLSAALENTTLRWKTSENTGDYAEGKPSVYCYTYDDTDGEMPLNTPSVLVQCTSMDGSGKCQFLIHCCVCNPALQDAETVADKDGDGIYSYSKSPRYSSSTVRSDLYRACLMLGEYVFLELQRMSNDGEAIENLILNTPSPYMDMFPYCECTVSCTVSIANEIRAKNDSLLKELL